MKNITITAPAKINLMLDITGKRQDGFHTLSTIMQSISLADTVFIELNDSGRILFECKADGIPDGKENIAYCAAEAFLKYSGISCGGLYIKVDKCIPFQAGLGGGSADCAAVLVGLNKLLDMDYSEKKLCEIGVKLGADVPFCIIGGTKICRGIGDIITEATPLESCYIVIGQGNKGISTKSAFSEIDAECLFCTDDLFHKYNGSIKSVKEVGKNIFEKTSGCAMIEDIKKIKEVFYGYGAEYSAMSGSGSAVFGIFSDVLYAERACGEIKKQGFFSGLYTPVEYGAKCLAN